MFPVNWEQDYPGMEQLSAIEAYIIALGVFMFTLNDLFLFTSFFRYMFSSIFAFFVNCRLIGMNSTFFSAFSASCCRSSSYSLLSV